MDKYILNGKKPVLCNDLIAWAVWYDKADRSVAQDKINGARISTVFLGTNHNYGMVGHTPILFETMIFGGPYDEYQFRYHTWAEAEAGHQRVLAALREGSEP